MTLKSRNDLSEDMEKAKGNGVRNGGFGIKKKQRPWGKADLVLHGGMNALKKRQGLFRFVSRKGQTPTGRDPPFRSSSRRQIAGDQPCLPERWARRALIVHNLHVSSYRRCNRQPRLCLTTQNHVTFDGRSTRANVHRSHRKFESWTICTKRLVCLCCVSTQRAQSSGPATMYVLLKLNAFRISRC
jgi:hypothetical protein